MEPGIYHDLSNEDYHAAPGISKSGLDLVHQCPYLYYKRRLDPARPPEKVRGGQLEGTLAHCTILEPAEFWKRYAVPPEDAPRRPTDRQINAKNPSEATVEAIEYWKRWDEENKGRELIPVEKADVAWAQAQSVKMVPEIQKALSEGIAEPSGFWIDEKTGVLCKVRPDWVHSTPKGDIILDVKTYSSADPRGWGRQAARKRYHVQAAYYSHGWEQVSGNKVLAFVNIIVEAEWPHAASATMFDQPAWDEGNDRWREDLDRYAECKKNDSWPMYSDAIEIVGLPVYAFYGDD